MSQKFQRGDHVQVADDLGECMAHFQSGCEAIVVGSYRDQYGGDTTDIYTLFIKDSGEVSWYQEPQLTLIEAGRTDLLTQWQDTARSREAALRGPSTILTIELNEEALTAAYVAADNCTACTCEGGDLYCFYRLDVEGKKIVCIKAAIETYLRITGP